MTTTAQSPAVDTELSGLKRRVTDLERALADRNRLERPDTTFVLAGALYTSLSPPYPVPQRRSYWEAACVLGTASTSGPVVVEIAANSTLVFTVTFVEGATMLLQPIDLTIARNGLLTAEITDPGDGARDLTISLRT